MPKGLTPLETPDPFLLQTCLGRSIAIRGRNMMDDIEHGSCSLENLSVECHMMFDPFSSYTVIMDVLNVFVVFHHKR